MLRTLRTYLIRSCCLVLRILKIPWENNSSIFFACYSKHTLRNMLHMKNTLLRCIIYYNQTFTVKLIMIRWRCDNNRLVPNIEISSKIGKWNFTRFFFFYFLTGKSELSSLKWSFQVIRKFKTAKLITKNRHNVKVGIFT